MIEIDGVEYRTSVQWEKKHRHVKKGQLGRGVERTWGSTDGNTTAMFYSEEQTRPWAKKDIAAVNRKRRGAAKAKRDAEECSRVENEVSDEQWVRNIEVSGGQWVRDLERCWGVGFRTTGLTYEDIRDHTAYQWLALDLVPIAEAKWEPKTYDFRGTSTWYYCSEWDVRYAPEKAKELLETGPREYDRLPDGRPYDGRPWW